MYKALPDFEVLDKVGEKDGVKIKARVTSSRNEARSE